MQWDIGLQVCPKLNLPDNCPEDSLGSAILTVLKPYELHQVNSNRYIGRSPFKADGGRTDFFLFIQEDGNDGDWLDVGFGKSGELHELVDLLEIPTPGKQSLAELDTQGNTRACNAVPGKLRPNTSALHAQ